MADKGDAFQKPGSDHLVAGFHVGEIQIRNDVAQESEKMIPKLMAEEKDTPVFAGEKTRTKDCIGLFLQKNLNHS